MTCRTQTLQGLVQLQQILTILTTRANASINGLGHISRILGAKKLRVIRHPNVDQAVQVFCLGVGRVKRRVLNAVSIYLPNVKILPDFFDLARNDMVSYSPDVLIVRRYLLEGCQWKWPKNSRDRELTESLSVAQNRRSMRVTTRPGDSGVPRWSSLIGVSRARMSGLGTLPRLPSSEGQKVRNSIRWLTCQNLRTYPLI